MNTIEEALKAVAEHKARTEELNRAFRDNGKAMLKPLFDKFFADEPRAQSVKWSQYTPHFNDGDACVFRVNEPNAYDAEAAELQCWSKNYEGFSAPLKKFCDALNSLGDDAMLAMFGDHAEITVTREGSIEVEEYDHD